MDRPVLFQLRHRARAREMAWWIKGETESWSPKLTKSWMQKGHLEPQSTECPRAPTPENAGEPLKGAGLPRQASLAHAEANAVAAGGKSPH